FSFHPSSTPIIYTLSLHDALPISPRMKRQGIAVCIGVDPTTVAGLSLASWPTLRQRPVSITDIPIWHSSLRPTMPKWLGRKRVRSEEHTSELQSLRHLVCRLLLEK